MADLRPQHPTPHNTDDSRDHPNTHSLTQDSSIPTTPDGKVLDLSFLDPPDEKDDLGRIAHYRIQNVLGVGGMGVVFRAIDTHLRRTVALKVMRREYIESYTSRERFLQEARIVASLESDFLVTVYQVGMHKDVPYLAMQYLHGETLESRLDREGKLPLSDALIIARHVAAGLAAAHARGLVHRDIKPANVWLETDPNTKQFRRAKVLDFGLARVLDSSRKLTNMGIILGTPQFMSPEQTRGSLVDSRSDLFSLGSVMYTMLTGVVPFDADSAPALLVALISSEPPPVSAVNPAIPGVVSDLVCRLMEKYPIARMQAAEEVIETIDAVCCELSGIPMHRLTGTDPFAPLEAATETPSTTQLVTRQAKTVPSFQLAPKTVPSITLPPPSPPGLPIELTATTLPAFDARDVRGLQRRPELGRWVLRAGVVLSLLLCAFMGALYAFRSPAEPTGTQDSSDVRLAILFPRIGHQNEPSLVDATILAIDELNQQGGILGRRIVPVEIDSGSEDEDKVAEKLFRERNIVAVFGPSSSSSRRSLRNYVERHNSLLFYPMAYEGMETSSRLVYTGPTAAQTVDPAIRHLLSAGKKRFFYIGPDDIQGRAECALVRDLVREQVGASTVGEAFVPTGDSDFAKVIATIQAAKPDIVVNGITDHRAVRFTELYRAAPERGKILHLAYLEDFDSILGNQSKVDDYVISFFPKESPNRGAFVQRFGKKYAGGRVVTDAIASAYTAVHLWAAAATAAQSTAPDAVLAKLSNLEIDSPFGRLRMDADTHHLRHRCVLGQFQADGQLSPIFKWEAAGPIAYPSSRTPQEWDRFVKRTSSEWGNAWVAPKK